MSSGTSFRRLDIGKLTPSRGPLRAKSAYRGSGRQVPTGLIAETPGIPMLVLCAFARKMDEANRDGSWPRRSRSDRRGPRIAQRVALRQAGALEEREDFWPTR